LDGQPTRVRAYLAGVAGNVGAADAVVNAVASSQCQFALRMSTLGYPTPHIHRTGIPAIRRK